MSDFNELINSKKPTLVDFYADWCGPCKMMKSIIEDTKAIKYGIRSIPTLILFKEGEVVWRQSGVPPKSLIVESVKKFI